MLDHKRQLVIFVWLVLYHQTSLAQPCNQIDRCKCEMTDGSGVINLKSLGNQGLGNQDPAFQLLADDGWYYRYNPCYAWTSPYYRYNGLAILQAGTDGLSEFVLGIQITESFYYSPATGISIRYEDYDYLQERNSSVLLICNPGITEHIFEFLGELITTEYEFILSGPCACPGICDDNGIIFETTAIMTTTIPPVQNGTVKPGDDSSFNWDHLGNMMVGLLVHDVILVFIIALVLILMRFVCGYEYSSKQPSKKPMFSEA